MQWNDDASKDCWYIIDNLPEGMNLTTFKNAFDNSDMVLNNGNIKDIKKYEQELKIHYAHYKIWSKMKNKKYYSHTDCLQEAISKGAWRIFNKNDFEMLSYIDGKYRLFALKTWREMHNHLITVDANGREALWNPGSIPEFDKDYPIMDIDMRVDLPLGANVKERIFNLWDPIPEPIQTGKNTSRLWEVLRLNFGSDTDWVSQWIAQALRDPKTKPGTSLVIHGDQGTGKSTFTNILRALAGGNKLYTTQVNPFINQFNSDMAGKLFINLNEVQLKAKEGELSQFKAHITESKVTIEAKGRDRIEVDSFARFFITTNYDRPLYLEPGNRRFAVFAADSKRKGDQLFWDEVYKDINDTDVMMQLRYEIWNTPFDMAKLRNPPLTNAQLELIKKSLSAFDKFLYDIITEEKTGAHTIEYLRNELRGINRYRMYSREEVSSNIEKFIKNYSGICKAKLTFCTVKDSINTDLYEEEGILFEGGELTAEETARNAGKGFVNEVIDDYE